MRDWGHNCFNLSVWTIQKGIVQYVISDSLEPFSYLLAIPLPFRVLVQVLAKEYYSCVCDLYSRFLLGPIFMFLSLTSPLYIHIALIICMLFIVGNQPTNQMFWKKIKLKNGSQLNYFVTMLFQKSPTCMIKFSLQLHYL